MNGLKLNTSKIGDMDDLDINSFTMKPDALIYFTISQIVGLPSKGIEQGKEVIDIYRMKSMLVDDLEGLCEAQDYIRPDYKDEKGGRDPYYSMVEELEKKLGLESMLGGDIEYWEKKIILADKRLRFLEKRVFSSSAKFKELKY